MLIYSNVTAKSRFFTCCKGVAILDFFIRHYNKWALKLWNYSKLFKQSLLEEHLEGSYLNSNHLKMLDFKRVVPVMDLLCRDLGI